MLKNIINRLKRMVQLQLHRGKRVNLGFNCNIKNSKLGHDVFIGDDTTFINSEIGDNSYINNDAKIRDAKIGKFCSVGPGVKIVLGNHPTNLISTHPTFYSNNKPFPTISDKMYFTEYKNVVIGNDVWIGEDVLIPGGISIGDGAIIMSRAVVTKDVKPYSIVGGVPAKLIKFRFNDIEIAKILNSEWWNKDIEWLKKNQHLFLNPSLFFSKMNT